MGLIVRTPSMRSGEFLEGMINEYVPEGKNVSKNFIRAPKSTPSRIVAALTCLQFAFSIYATFLVYYMSSSVDLRTIKPDFSMGHQHRPALEADAGFQDSAATALNPAEVCEQELIDFQQKKSNDAVMIKFNRELYDDVNEVLDFQQRTFGAETLAELMRMRSLWSKKNNAP